MVIRIFIAGLLTAILALPVYPAYSAGNLKDKIKISNKDCRWLVRHRPAADVAYKPGVGVNGRRVKPADLQPDRQIKLPPIIAIPLTVPVGSLLKKGATSPVGASEVGVGLVTVDRQSGEVQYEGQTLAGGDSKRMVAACRKLLRGKY
ncbi:MAG: hypothetical protein HN478_23310 [Rhodospirillaceae bacterium]|nr:hypothetical protein [Rhodospirillaceae bacterium]MBT4045769.1 hypothetical protein [Rhodospirillaceae bacterium]MBT4488642.1 hypothetical protein [Rhodospirillaceae bacterium]MBT5192918.1 hypothetical protein [Rhodospirillaceae bacterium]MBT5897935.1 hypothetical protein [Rhodospirillaceae bacterium]